jgi:hypothetical protein
MAPHRGEEKPCHKIREMPFYKERGKKMAPGHAILCGP